MNADDPATSPWGNVRRRRANQFPEKREAVLSAAASLFRRKGYEGGSLSDLAEILNVTKPTLYYYVGSKDQLFSEIVTRVHDEMIEYIKAAMEKNMSGAEMLREVLIRYFHTITSDFGACIALATGQIAPEIDRQIKSRARAANDLVYQILLKGQKDGTLNVQDPSIVIQTIIGALNWSPRWYKPSGRVAPHEAAAMQVDILMNGIRSDRTPRPSPRQPRTRQP